MISARILPLLFGGIVVVILLDIPVTRAWVVAVPSSSSYTHAHHVRHRGGSSNDGGGVDVDGVGWRWKARRTRMATTTTTTTTTPGEEPEMETLIDTFLTSFESAWKIESGTTVVQDYFVPDSCNNNDDDDHNHDHIPFWRDMVAFTWNLVTIEGHESLSTALDHPGIRTSRRASSFQRTHQPLPPRRYCHDDGDRNKDRQEVLEFWADLTLDQVGTGKVHFKLLRTKTKTKTTTTTTSTGSGDQSDGSRGGGEDSSQWKIHTLLTALMDLAHQPFRVGPNRIRGHESGAIANRRYWPERLQQQQPLVDEETYPVVIIGGGQAGLSLGARLHLLDIPYIILEAGDTPGTAWRKRYPSLHLHDPVWYNHMPYLPFPETWPVLCPRDKIADWLEFYAKALDLNVHTRCKVTKVEPVVGPESSEKGDLWRVMISCPDEADRNDSSNSNNHQGSPSRTTTKSIVTKHVVFATGNSSKPRIPKNIPGLFMGLQIHSSQYRGGRNYRGKRVVVVGSNNSGWDIVQDLWEQGAEHVTMIQRSPSMVVSTKSVLTHGLGSLYRQDAPLSHEDADLVATSTPYKLLIPRWKVVTQMMKATGAYVRRIFWESLAGAGYQLDDGPDGAGIFAKSATEGGGFYIDMGCAELVSRKDVRVCYAKVVRLESDGVVIQDMTTNSELSLSADVIVYATGYETMDQWVTQLCGMEIAGKVGRTWGLGLGKRRKDPGPWEGELRNMWKPTQVNGLWFHGGNLAQSRHYSRFLALQLTARLS